MMLSGQQQQAFDAIGKWYENGESQLFRLFGYAGTGKTTIAKYLREIIDGEVIFGAYTGKAAYVLRQKGCDNASTIHSLIYHSRDKSKEHLKTLEAELMQLLEDLKEFDIETIDSNTKVKKLRKEIKEEAENANQPMFVLNTESLLRDASLFVIDECSMIDERMGEHILSFGVPILVLGDPAQLPPVGGAGFFTERVKPDFMLEEIHRQATDSPILKMATQVRKGEFLEVGDYGQGCSVIPAGQKLSQEEILSYDQILVGKNDTRYASNMKIRRFMGIEDPFPTISERLVCLKNNSDLGLLNGAIFTVTDVDGLLDGKIHMSVRSEYSNVSVEVAALEHHFLGRGKELDRQYWLRAGAHEFDYGYALTVHKSQGSQWDSVCVFDESRYFRESRHRWLYTAITRAAERVTVVKM